MSPELCVVFTARERYAEAPAALEALFARAEVPFRLLIVDAATPQSYRRRIEAVVRGRPGVEFLSHDRYLLPNQARNLAVSAVREPFVLFHENDCHVRPGCVRRLLEESRASGAIAVPWLWEHGRGHFDLRAGSVSELPGGGLAILPGPGWASPPAAPQRLDFFENHAFLMPRAALEAMGPFDGELNTRELIDISLSVRKAGVRALLVPGAEVDFIPPPPIHWDELPHYRLRWDLERAEAGNERVRLRWGIAAMPGSKSFVWRQHLRVSRLTWAAWRLRRFIGRAWGKTLQRALRAFGG